MPGRPVLAKEQVHQIFALKEKSYASNLHTKYANVTITSRAFGVSDKTIRDIWSGRTWCHETGMPRKAHLRDHVGRPKGSKDATPRQIKRTNSIDEQLHMWAKTNFIQKQLFTDVFIMNLN